MDIREVLRKIAMISFFSPYTLISNAPILPNVKNIKSPRNGVNIRGARIGRLVTFLMVVNG